MNWSFKKTISTFLTTWVATFVLTKYKEAKMVVENLTSKDVKQVNKILKTGEFELPEKDTEVDDLF